CLPRLRLTASAAGGTLHAVVTSADSTLSLPAALPISVTVNPVAEKADLTGTVLTASGNEDSAIALTIVAARNDSDDNLSINISSTPDHTTHHNATLNLDCRHTLTTENLAALKPTAAEA